MTERLPVHERFDRRVALHSITERYGFTHLEADRLLGAAEHRIPGVEPGQFPSFDLTEQRRRYELFCDLAESMQSVMSPDAFRGVWQDIAIPSLAEAGYEVKYSRHRAVFKDIETGQTVDPAAAIKQAKTLFERWMEPDGPEVVSIWVRGLAAAGSR